MASQHGQPSAHEQYLDNLLAITLAVLDSVLTLIVIDFVCSSYGFRKTKLGQDMRAVGQDMDVAGESPYQVERTRMNLLLSCHSFAGLGMVIYQVYVNISTYSYTNGMFCIRSLVGGELL